ncbi:MAG: hypothetical protein ACRCTY_06030 [Candidatus Adiutrix sp.]
MGFVFFAIAPQTAQAVCECSYQLSEIVRNIQTAAQQQRAATMEAAQAQTAYTTAELIRIREAIKNSQTGIVAAVKASEIGIINNRTESAYEPASQPETNCGNDEMGGGYQASKATTQKALEDIMDKLVERKSRFQRPVDYRNELSDEEMPLAQEAIDLLGLTQPGKTLTTEEVKKNAQVIEAITDAIPAPNLDEESKETPAGKTYEMQKKNFDTKHIIYQSVIAKHIADRTPTIEGLEKWASGKWYDMGGSGDVPGLVEGKMSQDALRWLLANMRLASANYYEQILPALPTDGLLRDIAAMQATSLELQRKQVELLEAMAMMMAMQGIDKLEDEKRILLFQYDNVISQEQK